MPLGIDHFSFEEFQIAGSDQNKLKAKVKFIFDDVFEDGSPNAQEIIVTVRTNIHIDSTIADMQQVVLEKAVDQLHRSLEVCESKSAQEIILAAKADTIARQKSYQEERDRKLKDMFESQQDS